ncbi:AMP-binding protein [Vibrio rhizosphaerae]|uniref:AMP-binding protein n=1 Tax=Vibrio rhizosphaerae TaxID=398736 RepID=UPI00056EBD3B|nr:AMP-binding protein [Vibrio rhizosphaerae]
MFLFPESKSKIITEDGNEFLYSDLMKLGKEIHDLINEPTLVLCQVDNTLGGLLGYLTFAYGVHVPLILGVDIHDSHLDDIIKKYQPEFCWVPERLVPALYKNKDIVFSKYGYCLIRLGKEKHKKLPEELCLLASTSGSTGSPKFVRQSRNNIFSNTKSITEYLNLSEEDVAITSLPITYTYGMSIINCQILSGGDILLTNKSIVQKEFWEQFRCYNISILAGVPYTFEMMDRLRVFRNDLPHLKKILQAGGKLNEHLQSKIAQYCDANGKDLFVMYGQTEATTRMSYLPPEHCLRKIGSIGIAIPDGRFQIIDHSGNVIERAGDCGELVYIGHNVCLGYAECREDLYLPNQWNGYLKTGDLACFDEDNYFYIKGRLKRILKHFGLRINLDEIEHLIQMRFTSNKLACVDFDDFLIIFHEGIIENEKLLKYLSEVTDVKRAGVKIIALESIPILPNGKVNYQNLRTLV